MRAAKLAAAARALKRASGIADAPFTLAFLTDRRRLQRPEPILRALPAGAAVIYRDYDDPRRARVARRYAEICRRRRVLFIVAGDAGLARAIGADGLHLPARLLGRRPEAGGLILSASCHNEAELARAASIGAAIALVSPVFATQSHPDTEHLGAMRFKALAAASPLPVLALGGVDERNARLVAGRNVAGLGAIGAFSSRALDLQK